MRLPINRLEALELLDVFAVPEVESWAFLPELGETYQVSDQGRVRSIERIVRHKDGKVTHHQSRILKQGLSHKGYPVVWPSFAGEKRSFVVHRLVAKAFIENLFGYEEVNHIDEDKMNNHWGNLEWCTTAYNVEYSQANTALFVSPSGEVVEVTNLSKFSRENGLSNGKLSALLNGKRKSHKGWKAYETSRDS